MRQCLQHAVIAACIAALVGCSSLRVVMDVSGDGGIEPTSLSRPLAPNDALVLTRTDGTQVKLRLTALFPASVDGVDDAAAAKISVPLSQVARIERREFDGIKTACLVVAIAGGVYFVVKALAEASLASNI